MVRAIPAENWIAINFGYTNFVASFWKNGVIETIDKDENGQPMQANVVYNPKGTVNVSCSKPSNRKGLQTISRTKAMIGRTYNDSMPTNIIEGDNQEPIIKVFSKVEKTLSIEEVHAKILEEIKNKVNERVTVEGGIKNCVIAVPYYFNDSQRKATIRAA